MPVCYKVQLNWSACSRSLTGCPLHCVPLTPQVHVLLLGAPWWPAAREDWPQMIPTITLMSTLPPMALLLLKGLLVLPPASIILRRVRSGKWARKDDGGDPLAHTAVFALKQH